jgi:carboxymethylenebutenolidase
MTTEIARFMVKLEGIWDDHVAASLRTHDLAGSLANLVPEPSLLHIPAMTGASGAAALERFYREDLFGHVPADLTLRRISRTVDRFHLVDEATVSFTHDRELPWLLPDVAPTHNRAEVLTITVVGFRRGLISSQRVLWDHATLSAQLGLVESRGAGQFAGG